MRGATRIRGLLGDVEKKWLALTSLCDQKHTELADTRAQVLACEQRYNDLDGQLRQHARTFEATAATPPSKEQLDKILSLQFGIIRMEPMVHSFETATDNLLQTLPPYSDTSDLSGRVGEIRSRYDRLREAIESRLENLQVTLSTERLNQFSDHLDQLQQKLDGCVYHGLNVFYHIKSLTLSFLNLI